MNTSHSDDDIIAAFMNEFEIASDKQPIIAALPSAIQLGRSFFADYASGRSLMNEAAVGSPSSQHLQPGEMLGDFRIVREVDRGGQGEIYEAKQLHLSERRVAVKVIRQGKVSAAARDRFLREQKVLAKLHQSNILPAFAAGERGEIQYFAMPYVDGASNRVFLLRGALARVRIAAEDVHRQDPEIPAARAFALDVGDRMSAAGEAQPEPRPEGSGAARSE